MSSTQSPLHSASRSQKLTLRVFVSSPSDLSTTRQTASRVITKLSGQEIEGIIVDFIPLLWEERVPHAGGEAPQKSVDRYLGSASEADIYVGIFWTSLGSIAVDQERGQRHRSGTLKEFQDAYESFKRTNRPRLLLYRCTKEAEGSQENQPVADVETFFRGFEEQRPLFDGWMGSFEDDESFETLLTSELLIVAKDILKQEELDRQAAVTSEKPKISWISKLNPLNKSTAKTELNLAASVDEFLQTFEDLFGRASEKDRKIHGQLNHAFRPRYRALPDPYNLEREIPDHDLPKIDRQTVVDHLPPEASESLLLLYEKWEKKILFIGGRGTGKTFSMILLMRELLDRAKRDPKYPVPVYFNLPSWVEMRSQNTKSSPLRKLWTTLFPSNSEQDNSLEQWLEDQMVRNYSMQRKTARKLIENRRLVFCLDGLDELGAGNHKTNLEHANARKLRDDCVEAINVLADDHAASVILCCRDGVYDELGVKPRLGIPLKGQLLNDKDVESYLWKKPSLDGLRSVLVESTFLDEKARIPLFLGMMSVAYLDMERSIILQATSKTESEWLKHLLDHYVQKCIENAQDETDKTNKKRVTKFLSWMSRNPDSDFVLDDMQPSALYAGNTSNSTQLHRSYCFWSRSVLAFALMIIVSIPTGLANGFEFLIHEGWQSGISHCLVMWGGGACILLPLNYRAFSAKTWVGFGLYFGLGWSIYSALLIYRSIPIANETGDGTLDGALRMLASSFVSATIFFGIVGMQFYDRLNDHRKRSAFQPEIMTDAIEIVPIEPLTWRWFDRNFPLRGGWIGIPLGLLICFIGILMGERVNSFVSGSMVTIVATVLGGFGGTGLSSTAIQPNQGIARSLRHALSMAAIITVLGSAAWGLSYWMERGWVKGIAGSLMGLTLGFSFFIFGGIPFLKQFVLGCVLSGQGILPSWWRWKPCKRSTEPLYPNPVEMS